MPAQQNTPTPISKINNVSTRNINIITRYVQEKVGNSVILVSNLKYTPEYLLNEYNWIPLETYNEIMERAISLLNDPQAPYKMGLSALELESWGLFKYIRKIFLTLVIDPVMIYKKVSEYNPLFNNTKDVQLISFSKNHCVVEIKFKDDVNPIDDFYSDKYIQGLLASIPQVWKLPSSKIHSITHEYNLEELLHRTGGVPRHEMKSTDDTFSINGEVIGIYLKDFKQDSSWKTLISQAHTIQDENVFDYIIEKQQSNKERLILITKHYTANDHVTLSVGEIYNASHFIYHVSWETPPFGTQVKHLLSQSWKSRKTYEDSIIASLSTMKDYTSSLEQKVIERTHELELAKGEAEYWRKKADELLSTMLPEHIARTMIEKKLEPQEVNGTVLYTDIVGFTEYNRTHERTVVDEELRKYFAEIANIATRHGGWVNKFLGDGMLVVFGLHNNVDAAENAVQAGKQMVSNIEKYSWGTRVSVTTGPFTIGEFGNGELRRFDCVGQTLNLGSRLQSYAETNEIIVCHGTYNELIQTGNHVFKGKKSLNIKGIGDVEAYPLVTEYN